MCSIPRQYLKNRSGAPYGDAILAGVASGFFKDYSIAQQKAELIELMEPSKKNHEIYMDYFDLYKKLYKHLQTDFRELAVIREKYI